MKPFRATYTPLKAKIEEGNDFPELVPDIDNARTVLVMAFLPEGEETPPEAVFIDSDNSLRSAPLDRFTDCQSSEWRDG